MKKRSKKNDTNILMIGVLALAGVGGLVAYRRSQETSSPPATPAVDTSEAVTPAPFGVSWRTLSTTPTVLQGNPETGSLFTLKGWNFNQSVKAVLPISGGNNVIGTSSDVVGTSYGVGLGGLPTSDNFGVSYRNTGGILQPWWATQ